jgi:hypothetical protein
MKTKKIEIVIDEQGQIHSETFGIEGKLCIEELELLFKGIDEFQVLNHTADFYKKPKVLIQNNQEIKRK